METEETLDDTKIQKSVDQFFDEEELRGNTIDEERREHNEDLPEGEQKEMFTGSDKSDLEIERDELEQFVERTFSDFNVKMNLVLTPTQGNKNAITIPIASGERVPADFVEECLLLALNSKRIKTVLRAILGEPGYLNEESDLEPGEMLIRAYTPNFKPATDFLKLSELSEALGAITSEFTGDYNEFFKGLAGENDEQAEETETE